MHSPLLALLLRATRDAVVAAILVGLTGVVLAPASTSAAAGSKVVIVVGPSGPSYNRLYRSEANAVYQEARRYTSNVVRVYTPYATWSKVKAAAAGASILVYFGHGNGYPSVYGAFHGDTKNGMGLDPTRGANGTRHRNYGEDYVRTLRLAPNAAVLLYRLCYADGHTEPGMSEGTTRQSRTRVDGYGAGFLRAGARIVMATGHPRTPGNYVRQLFTTDRTMEQVFRASPDFRNHLLGSYPSSRTPGVRYLLDPDRGGSDPAGFYHSAVGALGLRTTEVTNRGEPMPSPTPALEPTAPNEMTPAPPTEAPSEVSAPPSFEAAPETSPSRSSEPPVEVAPPPPESSPVRSEASAL